MPDDYSSLIKLTTVIDKMLLIVTGPQYEGLENFDYGLRHLLNPALDFSALGRTMSKAVERDALLCTEDNLGLHYIIFHPKAEAEVLAIVGPFRLEGNQMEKAEVPAWISKQMLNAFYDRVSCIEDEGLLRQWLLTCCDLFGMDKPYRIVKKKNLSFLQISENEEELTAHIPVFSEYLLQKHQEALFYLLSVVSKGDSAKVLQAKQQLLRIRPMQQELSSLESWKKKLNYLNNILRYTAAYSNVNLTSLNRIYYGYEKQIENIQTMEFCESVMTQMLLWYCDCMGRHVQYDYGVLVQQVIDYINAHLPEKLSLGVVATYFSVNPSYLSDLFRRETGFTLTSFVARQRVCQAERLLLTSNEPVAQVAAQVGILDVNYFTHLFKRINGLPPGQYRKENKKIKKE